MCDATIPSAFSGQNSKPYWCMESLVKSGNTFLLAN